MMTLSNILIDGFAQGMVLFMISAGLSVTMGLTRVVNLAQGGFAVLGAPPVCAVCAARSTVGSDVGSDIMDPKIDGSTARTRDARAIESAFASMTNACPRGESVFPMVFSLVGTIRSWPFILNL